MPSSAKEKVVALSKRFIFEYENALVTLKLPSFPYVERGDNTALFLERLRYKIEFAKVFSTEYMNLEEKEFQIIDYKKEGETHCLTAYASFKFQYCDAPDGLQSGHGMIYMIEVENVDGQMTIVSIDTDANDFITFREEIKSMQSKNESFCSAAKAFADNRILQLENELEFWNEQIKAFDVKSNSGYDAVSNNIRSTSVNYNRSAAVSYAATFGDQYENYIFKRMSADCTNFVSQCLWAGYGGAQGCALTNPEPLRNRVAANYRQTSSWYGRNYNSSSEYAAGPFMRVVELWSYATTNTGDGPRAVGYNDGNVWTSLTVLPQIGDILQFYNTSLGRYWHSVIVTRITTNLTQSNILDNVWISQHSGDYVNRPLRETLADNGGIMSGKMRLMCPGATTFGS